MTFDLGNLLGGLLQGYRGYSQARAGQHPGAHPGLPAERVPLNAGSTRIPELLQHGAPGGMNLPDPHFGDPGTRTGGTLPDPHFGGLHASDPLGPGGFTDPGLSGPGGFTDPEVVGLRDEQLLAALRRKYGGRL
jgi:hypothetical protein